MAGILLLHRLSLFLATTRPRVLPRKYATRANPFSVLTIAILALSAQTEGVLFTNGLGFGDGMCPLLEYSRARTKTPAWAGRVASMGQGV